MRIRPPDMRGLSISMLSNSVLELFKGIADIDKNNYPETLHQVCRAAAYALL